MLNYLVFALIFFLPAGVANATPVFANRVPLLKNWRTPMDFGASFGGKRILGDNKSWRGFWTGAVLAGLTAVLLALLLGSSASLLGAFFLGTLMGVGALLGDVVESFIKRRRGIPSGKSWFPFDQLDYIIGGLIITYPFTRLPLTSMLVIVALFFGLHLISVYVAYKLGLKDKPI